MKYQVAKVIYYNAWSRNNIIHYKVHSLRLAYFRVHNENNNKAESLFIFMRHRRTCRVETHDPIVPYSSSEPATWNVAATNGQYIWIVLASVTRMDKGDLTITCIFGRVGFRLVLRKATHFILSFSKSFTFQNGFSRTRWFTPRCSYPMFTHQNFIINKLGWGDLPNSFKLSCS